MFTKQKQVRSLFLLIALLFSLSLSVAGCGSTPRPEPLATPAAAEVTAPADTPVQATDTPIPPVDTTAPDAPTDTTAPDTPTQSPTNTSAPSPQCSVKSTALNLRNGPGIAYEPPITALPRGTDLEPLAFWPSGHPDGGQWIQVRVPNNGQEGWVSAGSSYISCNFDVSTLPPGTAPPTPTLPPRPTSTPTPLPAPYVELPPKLIVRNAPCELCATLNWTTENVGGVYLDGERVDDSGSHQVCLTQQDADALGLCYHVEVRRSVLFQVEKEGGDVEQTVDVVWTDPQCATLFYAEPSRVTRGECAMLEWQIAVWNYNQALVGGVYLDGQQVPPHSAQQVCPEQTQTYTLRVATRCGNIDVENQVTVTQP